MNKECRLPSSARFLTLVFAVLLLSACSRQPVYPAPPLSGRHVAVELATLKPETPRFFTYRFLDKNVNFFVMKIGGKTLSFLDACVSCYPHKQGYRWEGSTVTCRYCGMRFSIYQLEKGLGSCYPIKIEGKEENGKYLIPVSTLESASDKF